MGDKMRHLKAMAGQVRPEFFCLLMLLGIDFIMMALGPFGSYFVDYYTMIPAMLFLGVLLAQKSFSNARWQFLLGGVFVLWFMAVQRVHLSKDMNSDHLGAIVSVFLLAFPFAAATKDGAKDVGLKMAGLVCLGATLVLTGLTAIMELGLLPGFLKPYMYWDGTRLHPMWHPNGGACMIMMGIGFSLAFFSLAKKWAAKLLLAAVVAVQLLMIVLTNSRTTLGMALLMVVGYVFFWILHKGGWKRFAIAAAVVIVLGSALLVGVISVKQASDQQKLEAYLASADYDPSQVIVDPETGEMKLRVRSGQGSFLQDLKTFNGRTNMWQAVVQAFRDIPEIRLWGVDNVQTLNGRQSFEFQFPHVHNAWVETWVRLGIPGLIFALVFTILAVWRIAVVLLNPAVDMYRKSIALLVVCIMGAAMLEPYLFYMDRDCHPVNMIFFLCLGYMDQWCKKTV